MISALWVFLLLVFCVTASAQTWKRPASGFEENIGQLPAGVLFASETLAYSDTSVALRSDAPQFRAPLAVRFASDRPGGGVVFEERLPWKLHSYPGADSSSWRTNVPHYGRARIGQLAPGIEAEWRTGTRASILRLTVSPGASLDALRLVFESTIPIAFYQQNEGPLVIGGLYDPARDRPDSFALLTLGAISTSPAAIVRYERTDGNNVRLVAEAYEKAQPLVIDIPFEESIAGGGFFILGDDGSYMEGGRGYIARLGANGEPIFLTRLNGSITVERADATRTGGLFVSGLAGQHLPLTADAPQKTFSFEFGSFMAFFNADGTLRSATYGGGGVTSLGPSGSIYFADSNQADSGFYLGQWTPGEPAFRRISGLSFFPSFFEQDLDGNLVYGSFGSPGLPTTAGSLSRVFEGNHQVYLAKVNPVTGQILWGTYVPVAQEGFWYLSSLAIDRAGDVWIAAYHATLGGSALVRLAKDGSRVLSAEGLPMPVVYSLRLDAGGNLRMLGRTTLGALPTAPDALLRGPCAESWYLRIFDTRGITRYATYLADDFLLSRSIVMDRGGDLFEQTREGVRKLELSAATEPGLSCLVHSAARTPLGLVAPGQLVTLLGQRLGPLNGVSAARPDSLPTELAGVRVFFDDVAAGIVSAQFGLVTARVPATLSPGSKVQLRVEVEAHALPLVSLNVVPSYFLPFDVDGHGWGQAAALNEDGSVNGPRAKSRPGSVISIFGTGDGGIPISVRVNSVPAEVLYSGPAPGLVPGVAQVNFRIPPSTPPGTALATVFALNGTEILGFQWPKVSVEIGP